ncbi:ABC transporter ATP-binding protein [Tumebacillus flagellatus]|uniref:ABC transporter ATP-binding protein n=1 Tax=Tumebacillus flagellatus TaxID=1157490 RepID=A0A074LQK6_9BACL|nr:ABC transporter ATP-binding protein [Tumebacillus flagellatus]KEO84426.1 hypothetical protein EL26_04815 [Tumebacillus flagellatus]
MKARTMVWVLKFFFASSSLPFVLMSLFGLLQAGLAASALLFLQQLVDGRSLSGLALVWLSVGYLLCALVLPNAFNILNQLFREAVLRRSQQILTRKLMQMSASIGMDSLEDAQFQDVVSAVTKADSSVMINYWQCVQEIVISLVRLVGVAAVLTSFYWGIPLVVFASVLPELWMRMRFAKLQHKLHLDQSAVERRASYFADVLTKREYVKEIRTSAAESFLYGKWRSQKDAYDRKDLAFDRKRQSYFGAGHLIFLTAISASMFFMVKWVMGGQTSVGALTSAIFALNYIVGSIGSLLYNFGQAQHQILLVETTRGFLEDTAAEQEPSPDLHRVTVPFDIRFENVSYRYPGAENFALQNVSFTITHGERIALVGANGSGKSTLIRLLLGLSRPTSGRIYLNEVPLEDCSWGHYRELVTVAFQDFAQYCRTVRENIGFGDLHALHLPHLLEQAAVQSGAADFIERLPRRYDQQLGAAFAGGVDLSGGQWQKTAMARAYLRQAALLLMDEPTASLDPMAEVEVYRQFSDLAEGKTALLVSHRLGSATLADRIFVLQQGELVEAGHHIELLRENGEYAKLFRSQAEWYLHDERAEAVEEPPVAGVQVQ